jgi:hypothetical protein
MNLYVCGGLGDCLIYCQIYHIYKSNFKYNYIFNIEFIKKYKSNYIEYTKFVENIYNTFNVPLNIVNELPLGNNIEPKELLIEYPLNEKLTLSNLISRPIINDLPEKYIVINLNIRIVTDDIIINKRNILNMISKLCDILNNTNFTIPIVIVGHRKTFKTFNIINFSFYNRLKIIKFIDKTYDNLMEVDIDRLYYDINILKNSEETFQFGFGGSLCLNIFFSKKLSAICNPENEFIQEYFTNIFFENNNNIQIFKNRINLLERLNNIITK